VRVFLDTNVLVSAFATRGICSDVLRVVLAEHSLVTSEIVLGELARVLRSRIRLPAENIAEITALLREHEVFPRPGAPAPLAIRDAQDRWVLASAIEARADVLVTGDRDLLDVADDAPLRIVDPRTFWELLRRS
jgi:putative PIN family toxin of toxin-antitoxin system